MADRVLLTIGTKKGVLVADAAKPRRRFALRGPFGPGGPVYATLIDTRGTPRLYASSCNPFFGMKVLRSTDLGKSFKETKSAPAFPKGDGRALANIWSLEGVVARIVTGPHEANRQDPHLPMRYDAGRPRAVIRFRISQPRTTSLPCPAGLRARRPSPMMDLYRKNVFSTRP